VVSSPLLPAQEELLAIMVEADRSVPRTERHAFLILEHFGGSALVHTGLGAIGKANYQPYVGDAKALASRGFIRLEAIDRSSFSADVTPEGFDHYEAIKTSSGQPIKRTEQMMRTYLMADEFRRRHPRAIEKWESAERALWSSDSQTKLTSIGHMCREALQAFATESLGLVGDPDADPDVQHTVSRMRTLIIGRIQSEALRHLRDTLLAYWGAVNDVVQRQEHGAAKEGEGISWEDGRRVVFQTLVVMHEVDRTRGSSRGLSPP
jgi:hypothetical protein